MLVAEFHLGPFDGRRLVLPTTQPWPRFVLPNWESPITIEHFYLYSGWMNDMAHYLFDDAFSTVIGDG